MPMIQRHLRALLVLAQLLVFMLAGSTEAQEAEATTSSPRPNIVVIMTDDLDVRSLNVLLERGLMPNLQSHIVGRSSDFRNSFVSNSICCPSRATFLTGQYTHNHRVLSNVAPIGGVGAFDDRSTLATWLQEAGYRTGWIGRYMNGYGRTDLNDDGVVDLRDARYIPPGWDDWQVLVEPYHFRMYGFWLNDNGTITRYGIEPAAYQTDVLAERAAAFIDQAAAPGGAPFFLTLMPTAPHVEILPGFSFDDYSDYWQWSIRPAPRHAEVIPESLPRQPSYNDWNVSSKPAWLQRLPLMSLEDQIYNERRIRSRMASMLAVDDMVGTVVTALQRTGTLRNTILIFTSDNGYLHGEHRLPEKGHVYEEAIRVPLYISVPGARASQTVHHLVLNNDLAPTIVEAAGAEAGLAVDGRSLRPLLRDPALPRWRLRFLLEHWNEERNLYDPPDYRAVRTGPLAPLVPDQLYVEYADEAGSQEFYDLAIDPNQRASLHADRSPLRRLQLATHRAWLAALSTCGDGSCQILEDAARLP